MKILLVTARAKYSPNWLDPLQELDPRVQNEITVLAVHQPKSPLAEIDRFVIVDPSSVPFRPVTEFPVQGKELKLRWTHSFVRVLRVLRKVRSKLFGPPAENRSSSQLAIACRTSPTIKKLAGESDVVVAMDAAAGLGVWYLARRVAGPQYLFALGTLVDKLVVKTASENLELSEPTRAVEPVTVEDFPQMPELEPASCRLLIAPLNRAGNEQFWARSASAHLPDVAARSMVVSNRDQPSDLIVDTAHFNTDLAWRRYWRKHVVETYTHILAESGSPIFGGSVTGTENQYLQLSGYGINVARLAIGRDVRIPSFQAKSNPWSPYAALGSEQVRHLESVTRHMVDIFESHDGELFVATPGLQEFIPRATWLPIALDTAEWSTDLPVMNRSVPVVAHVPSNSLEGWTAIDSILKDMHRSGEIEYRKVGKGDPAKRISKFAAADIFVDQFETADYGRPACEAMALGRIVVGHVSAEVREQVLRQTGLELPIVEANPETLPAVLGDIIKKRDQAPEMAQQSRDFAVKVHGGQASAEALRPWLLPAGS
ncbi:MAG TPA: hypothetical protein PLQ19_07055 [Aeromicrobium sp.]|nr:hypothetical protein [Aeromicrobium sp.]